MTVIYPIKGISLVSASGALRYQDRDDVVLLRAQAGSSVAIVSTKSQLKAAPVQILLQHFSKISPKYPLFLLINAGSANAATGKAGISDALKSCELVADYHGVAKEQVLPFSTGVIGEPLPMLKFTQVIEKINKKMSLTLSSDVQDWRRAVNAIMTTDTKEKIVSRQLHLNGKKIHLTGIAKGSGMICPNMATMLGYIATDALISAPLLQECLQQANALSFNRITVDGDTSTNDAVALIATGASECDISQLNDVDKTNFICELAQLMQTLARSVIEDAEGGTKVIKVHVHNALNDKEAENIVRSVAHSPLMKTALFASDPNWGRLFMAIGKADVAKLVEEKIDIDINQQPLVRSGQLCENYSEEKGQEWFSQRDITIDIGVNQGDSDYWMWTSDLSYDYVRINAEYRS